MVEILIGSDHAYRSEESRLNLTPSRRWFILLRLRDIDREHRGEPLIRQHRFQRRYGRTLLWQVTIL
jgi:hypothetical protein